MALMVAATPKQIAMARQIANSESHIAPSGPVITLFDALNPNQKRLSHVLRSSTLSCVFLGALGERKPPVGHFDENRFMCRSAGCLRQSNALSGVVA
jgi:hypothetical protein